MTLAMQNVIACDEPQIEGLDTQVTPQLSTIGGYITKPNARPT
jgi:hypothetical protein